MEKKQINYTKYTKEYVSKLSDKALDHLCSELGIHIYNTNDKTNINVLEIFVNEVIIRDPILTKELTNFYKGLKFKK